MVVTSEALKSLAISLSITGADHRFNAPPVQRMYQPACRQLESSWPVDTTLVGVAQWLAAFVE